MSNYSVCYGVNNSHVLDNINVFKLYGDAIKFHNSLDKIMYPAQIVFKLVYDSNGYVKERIPKKCIF